MGFFPASTCVCLCGSGGAAVFINHIALKMKLCKEGLPQIKGGKDNKE